MLEGQHTKMDVSFFMENKGLVSNDLSYLLDFIRNNGGYNGIKVSLDSPLVVRRSA